MKPIVFVADTAHSKLLEQLKSQYDLCLLPEVASLYEGIRNHTDLHVHIVDGLLVVSRDMLPYLKRELDRLDLTYYVALEYLGTAYPDTAILNGLTTQDYFIHNETITDIELLKLVQLKHREILNVKQGYVRCTTLPLTNRTLITCDDGIFKTLTKQNLDLIKIRQGHILLEGHDYGFIGGTAGRIENTLYFNGDITKHPDYAVIKSTCDKLGLPIWYVEGEPLRDIGSILSLEG